jgi:hypothetical protein
MTNHERIKNMKTEELAEFIESIFYDGGNGELKTDKWYCKKKCPKRINGKCTIDDDEVCPLTSKQIIVLWLNEEV